MTETPCAFIQLKPGADATEAQYIDWCRQNLARFKIPKAAVSYCGLKDKQGRTTQLVAIEEAVDVRVAVSVIAEGDAVHAQLQQVAPLGLVVHRPGNHFQPALVAGGDQRIGIGRV